MTSSTLGKTEYESSAVDEDKQIQIQRHQFAKRGACHGVPQAQVSELRQELG